MNQIFKKKEFDVSKIRRFLEPGPVVLVSSQYQGKSNIMTMGWHMVMEFSPSMIGCFITGANHSFELIRKSKECVINIPQYSMIDTVIGIGNTSGRDIDKFKHFSLTPAKSRSVKAPSIAECFANFECQVVDTSLLKKYSMFVLKVKRARIARYPKYPRTVHYRGDGIFMISGKSVNYKKRFKPENL